jgi:hypothetical protein
VSIKIGYVAAFTIPWAVVCSPNIAHPLGWHELASWPISLMFYALSIFIMFSAAWLEFYINPPITPTDEMDALFPISDNFGTHFGAIDGAGLVNGNGIVNGSGVRK